jgi:5-bromo-4-chloroindolyl phosphate hydrolysis protein
MNKNKINKFFYELHDINGNVKITEDWLVAEKAAKTKNSIIIEVDQTIVYLGEDASVTTTICRQIYI